MKPLVKIMKANTSTNRPAVLWLGDLHLDRASQRQRDILFDRISKTESNCVVVSGDISSSRHLHVHLEQLSAACAPRPVHFVTGNHDYHGSGINEVEGGLTALCGSHEYLNHLDGKSIIPLGGGVGLIGIRGWADLRAGYGHETVIDSPDRHAIRDFQGLTRDQALRKMTELGKESARAIRKVLPLALTQFRHVVIVTHVPPFPGAVTYDGRPCGRAHLPHFTNLSIGMAILGISRAFPERQITILAGHAHTRFMAEIRPNLSIRVGEARTGRPSVFGLIRF